MLHQSRRPTGDTVPQVLHDWLLPWRPCFTAPSWEYVLVLIMGALLAPGKRTVSACLRMTGRIDASNFASFHQILNRVRWSSRCAARRLLGVVIERLVPAGPVVIGMDDTIERRWGRRITARGIYRDPVRSSHGHFVKASGLRWLSFMILAPVPWAKLVKALPVLTLLAPSERSNRQSGRRHKLLTDWARQGALQLCRWLPGRQVIFVGDSSFAVHELAHVITSRATLISRLRLDASLYASPAKRTQRTMGRPAQKGSPLPKLKTLLDKPDIVWSRIIVSAWYGQTRGKELDIASSTALWYRPGTPVLPIRWVLVRDPEGRRAPQAFFSTDVSIEPTEIIALFVRRWQIEVTFAEPKASAAKHARISASKHNASGPTRLSPEPRQPCWACTASSLYGLAIYWLITPSHMLPLGIARPTSHSLMPSAPSASVYGSVTFSNAPRKNRKRH